LTDDETASIEADGSLSEVEPMTDEEETEWVNENPDAEEFFEEPPNWLPEPDPDYFDEGEYDPTVEYEQEPELSPEEVPDTPPEEDPVPDPEGEPEG
jgi:hypothetical protein